MRRADRVAAGLETGGRMAEAGVTIEAGAAAGGGRLVRFAGPMVVGDVQALRASLAALDLQGPTGAQGAAPVQTTGAPGAAPIRATGDPGAASIRTADAGAAAGDQTGGAEDAASDQDRGAQGAAGNQDNGAQGAAGSATGARAAAGGPTGDTTGDATGAGAGETAAGPDAITLDLSAAGAMDTAGAWLVIDLRRRLAAQGVETRVQGADAKQTLILETVDKALPREAPPPPPARGLIPWIGRVGEGTATFYTGARDMIGFAGEIIARFLGVAFRPWRFPFTSLVHHMQDVGLNAIPIVSLMAFLIGVVLAFMGAVQLRQFGAEVFVIDLIAITLLRELGILMAAIIVAGRTASAFTAAIGSMKLREEIDAMRTLSIDPVTNLVVPRIVALVIMLPMLGFIANIAGLLGGGLMSWAELGISPALFVARLRDAGDGWNFAVGMIKAPFFAAVIGLVGCFEGMQVEKSAESLGARTSEAVVVAIFMVIVMDAAFAIFFMKVGV